jgi:hypothetical protein
LPSPPDDIALSGSADRILVIRPIVFRFRDFEILRAGAVPLVGRSTALRLTEILHNRRNELLLRPSASTAYASEFHGTPVALRSEYRLVIGTSRGLPWPNGICSYGNRPKKRSRIHVFSQTFADRSGRPGRTPHFHIRPRFEPPDLHVDEWK